MKEKDRLMEKEKTVSVRITFLVLLSFILFFVFLTSISTVSAYVESAPAYTFGYQTGNYVGGQLYPTFDRNLCQLQ